MNTSSQIQPVNLGQGATDFAEQSGDKSSATINAIRSAWSLGRKRKDIARDFGVSERTVGRLCADLHKPVEHRGRKKSGRVIYHAEDFDIHAEDFDISIEGLK